MKLERRTNLLVPIQHQSRPASDAELEALLADPQRVLQQLLSGEQLEPLGECVFLYTPRPLELPGYRLAPQVRFVAHWRSPALEISLLSYQLPGLAALERKAHYHFNSRLLPAAGALQVEASGELELATGEQGLRLPEPLLGFLGNRVLGLIFGRLERRCRRNLPQLTLDLASGA